MRNMARGIVRAGLASSILRSLRYVIIIEYEKEINLIQALLDFEGACQKFDAPNHHMGNVDDRPLTHDIPQELFYRTREAFAFLHDWRSTRRESRCCREEPPPSGIALLTS